MSKCLPELIALSFDGVDDYVEIDDADELDNMSNLMILQSWVKFNSYNDYNGQGKAYILFLSSIILMLMLEFIYAMYTHHDANMLTFLVRTDQNQQKGALGLDYESYRWSVAPHCWSL